MRTRAFRIICLLAGVTVLTTQIGSGVFASGQETASFAAVEETVYRPALAGAGKGSSVNGHDWIAENSDYELFMSEEDLSIIVRNKATGAYLESAISYDDGQNNATWMGMMRSAVVLTLIRGNDDTKQVDLINDNAKKEIRYTDNGFEADITFPSYGFSMTLEVALTEEGLTARIPDASIKEANDDSYIGTIAIYPFLGHSYLDEKEGYLLVPDGNGALIYLDDKEGAYSTGYVAPIYGSDIGFEENAVISLLWSKYEMVTDAEQVIAPIYGIAHTDDQIALLGIVEDGATRANIEAYPNGVSINYNRAFARFVERKLYTQPTSNNSTTGSFQMVEPERSHSDLQVRYLFLSGDQANYAGMANAYRSYLLDNGMLKTMDAGYHTRVDFLGTDRESWLLGTKAVVMTTTDDIRTIYGDLEKEGVSDLVSIYKGWQKGGVYDLPISKYKADRKIGGTSELTKLIQETEAEGSKLYLYADALRINPDEHNAAFNVVKQINKRRYYEETYKDVYEEFMFQTPERAVSLLDRLMKSYTKKGVDNLCVAGLSNNLFSFSYSGSNYSRAYTGETIETAMDAMAEKTDLVLEQPFVYLWHDTEAFLDMPLYTSNFILTDDEVPFLSLVLYGVMPVYSEYVNFEANKQEFFLKMVETGTYPSFLITKESSARLIYTNSNDIYSSEYASYRDTIISYDKELKAFHEKTAGALIVGHDKLNDGEVVRVSYDNGVKVYVNYGNAQAQADGVTIPALSYEVVG